MINHIDGQFALDCWQSEDDEKQEKTEFSDSLPELRARAEKLQKDGHFNYLEICRWNALTGKWDEIEAYD